MIFCSGHVGISESGKFIEFFKIQANDIIYGNRRENLATFTNNLDFTTINNSNDISFIESLKEKSFNVSMSGVLSKLSNREIECIKFIVKGFTIKQIARELQLSPRTVEHHINNIKNKVGLTTKAA